MQKEPNIIGLRRCWKEKHGDILDDNRKLKSSNTSQLSTTTLSREGSLGRNIFINSSKPLVSRGLFGTSRLVKNIDSFSDLDLQASSTNSTILMTSRSIGDQHPENTRLVTAIFLSEEQCSKSLLTRSTAST